ncbi:MAG: DUF1800 domain-containing protein [bacterium]|nr:DUF1800 domain-containing protein [bacterium]
MYSSNQLTELMVQFWQRHFNTNFNKLRGFFLDPANAQYLANLPAGLTTDQKATAAAAYIEFLQNQAFRANALGEFRDLLRASAQSPAMLIFLDGVANQVPPGSNARANENYSRELLELRG